MRILLACQTATGAAALRQSLASLLSLTDLNLSATVPPANTAAVAEALRSLEFPDNAVLQVGCLPTQHLLAAAQSAHCQIVATVRNPYDAFAAIYRNANVRPSTVAGKHGAVLAGRPSGDSIVLQFIREYFPHHLRSTLSWLNVPQAHLLRYENLCNDPRGTLLHICNALGVDPTARELLPATEVLRKALVPPQATPGFHPDANVSCADILSIAAIECITDNFGSVVEQLGYDKLGASEIKALIQTPSDDRHAEIMDRKDDRDAPFFLVGSVRSGTTMLRDLLRLHPRLECPEETHFFRWSDPFGSHRYNAIYKGQVKLMREHRELDGIDETRFDDLLHTSVSRRDLAVRYARLYCEKRENPRARWFDKTPQNIYGILLIRAMFPQSLLVHIHRNPLNVVASVLEGRVVRGQSLAGAINFWLESMMIIQQFKEAWPEQLIEVAYERFVEDPRGSIDWLLVALREDPRSLDLNAASFKVYKEQNRYRRVLSARQVEQVISSCERYMAIYGYTHRGY